jgi:hypothetical protein
MLFSVLVFVSCSWFYGVLIGGNLTVLLPYTSTGLYLLVGIVLALMPFKVSEIAAAFGDALSKDWSEIAPKRLALDRKIFAGLGLRWSICILRSV